MDSGGNSAGFRPAQVLILVLLLIPSAAFLWRNSDAPSFGDLHDDSLYYVSAKSLAGGHYRIESLPGAPAQTKYPPLYPLLLSLAWRIDPQFPGNLSIAVWLSWAALPLLLGLLAIYYPRIGIYGWRKWLMLVLLAVNPYIAFFASTLFSELWFTALLAAALILIERAADAESPPGWAAAAGLVSGFAYLTRTAGIVLLASAPLYFWMKGRRRDAAIFAGGMLPFVAGWMAWSRTHMLSTSDPALIYYIDYVRYEFYNVHLSNLHLVLWKNIDGMLWGLGSILIPKVTDSLFLKILAELLTAGMIAGVVRMVKAGRAVHYAIFAAATALMLAFWHFPPNERYVLPLVPLAFAGLLTEMEQFTRTLKVARLHKDRSQRVASAVMAAFVTAIFVGGFSLEAYLALVLMNDASRQQRISSADHRAAYAWMKANLPASAQVLTGTDPVLFLYTGRAAMRRLPPPQLWYEEDHEGAREFYRSLGEYARSKGIAYVYYSPDDGRQDMTADDADTRDRLMKSNPDLIPIQNIGSGTVYRVRERSLAAGR